MCEGKEGETLYSYAFRQVVEKPAAVLACIGLIAATILYMDLRDLFRQQTDSYRVVGEQMSEMNVRLSEIEHRLDK